MTRRESARLSEWLWSVRETTALTSTSAQEPNTSNQTKSAIPSSIGDAIDEAHFHRDPAGGLGGFG